jgi:glycosyltransferase involved in cell wall biosynthesis
MTGSNFSIAIGGRDAPISDLIEDGWNIHIAEDIVGSMDSYHDFISTSLGEFSVAKNIYVSSHSGWFSERSVCYLASGKPVVVQDTGFSEYIPTGEGVVSITSLDDAINAIGEVEEEYSMHSIAAAQIARDTFSAELVINSMLGMI